MSNPKYKDIGKKDIINVINQVIQRLEALEMTLNIFIQFSDKDKEFNKFMEEKLGGNNELRPNETDNGKGDNPSNNEDS